jgi:16S rRNA (cytosine1402-N4)-methyltransferase
MVREVIEALAVEPGGRYVDCTLGGGGHAEAILQAASPGGLLLGIDADPLALELAGERLSPFGDSVRLVESNFSHLNDVCQRHNFAPVQGILFDLGLSSMQIADEERGFSFSMDAPLDMRFSPRQEVSAADIVNNYAEEDLADIIWRYGEERNSRRIARGIIRERPIKTAADLARVVAKAAGRQERRINPATRTFQALRIAVNTELDNLSSALAQAVNLLGYQGRLVVISYHSLEDRIVKHYFRELTRDCICPPEAPMCVCGHVAEYRLVVRGVVKPSADEVASNPRSRSARLRVLESLAEHRPVGESNGRSG